MRTFIERQYLEVRAYWRRQSNETLALCWISWCAHGKFGYAPGQLLELEIVWEVLTERFSQE